MKKVGRKVVPKSKVRKKPVRLPIVKPHSKFPIVGIGASAGGLEALEQFFTTMPADSGYAFVIVQHLDPTHKGMMPELLQRLIKMTVLQVKDGIRIKPNYVYIIPPNKSMSILNGILYLFEPLEIRGLRLPVDFFLHSLADDQRENSIGIILSGMGSDGTLGLRSIKEKGGLTLVQDPASAKFNGMPTSAIKAGLADIIAPAVELPLKLINVINRIPLIKEGVPNDKENQSALSKIIILLRSKTGNDFSQYKKNTLYRRIERRMGIHQVDKIDRYVRYLQEHPQEAEILFKELLIGVTSFFRDVAVWEQMRKKIIPALLASKPSGYVLRIWVPGCSTGEEAYSLAMILKEAIDKINKGKNLLVQIFATDLDFDSVEKARKGIYPKSITADVSSARLKRFFIKEGANYRIGGEVREMVVFATQNLIMDPPFTKLDIISCRNMMIYMENELQKKIVSLFHYSLNASGILLLGNAETTGIDSQFKAIDSKLRIYKRIKTANPRVALDFPNSFTNTKLNVKENSFPVKNTESIHVLADQLLLQNFAPPGVLVSEKGDIVYISGHTGNFLEPPTGKINWNIFAMLREGMQKGFSAAFRKARVQKTSITVRQANKSSDGGTQLVDIIIKWIQEPNTLQGMLMVIFKELTVIPEAKPTNRKSGKTIDDTDRNDMKLELKHVREELKTTYEEMQTSQEELKSTNEEFQSTNEELQSTNEELTTSKEEMQSLNEELQTVNSELQGKVDDFTKVNNDMKNLLESTDIATLFVDKELLVRGFTAQATSLIKLIQTDIGRPFTDLGSDLLYPEFVSDTKEVLRTLVSIEKKISTIDHRWFTIRIKPYRTLDDRIDGLVITFISITDSVIAQKALQHTTTILRSLIHAANSVIIGLSTAGTIQEFNPESEKLFGKEREDVIGHNFVDMFVHKEQKKKVESQIKVLLQGNQLGTFNSKVKGAGDTIMNMEWSVGQLHEDNGKFSGIIIIGQVVQPA